MMIVEKSNNNFTLFFVSLVVTVGYYFVRTSYGVDTDAPGELALFITIMMIFTAITLMYFIWWSITFATCNLRPDSNHLFSSEIDYLIKGYSALGGTAVAALVAFLYSQFKYHVGPKVDNALGFEILPKAAYGGKRKQKNKKH